MSRAFVKESDQEPAPVIPPRAPLPAGATNYVTPDGLAALHAELAELEAEKLALNLDNEDEQRRALTVLNGRLALLNERIGTAQPIDPAGQPREEVRFGAKVTLRYPDGKLRDFRIVGVDEADVKQKKLAFTAPLARAVTGRWVGETGELQLGDRRLALGVVAIDYD